jgi:ComF family protein
MYEEKTIKTAIYRLKFDFLKPVAGPLGDLLVDYLYGLPEKFGMAEFCKTTPVVIPIPLSSSRERWRGFNQSTLIGSHFAKRTKLPLSTKKLVRIHYVKPQSETENREERFQNIAGSFRAVAPTPKHIFLIDDVMTSGATLREAASVLRAAGAEKIIALAVARA